MKKVIICIIGILYLFSCANKKALTGGPKDLVPPKIVSSIPAKESVNINPQIIKIYFDEQIQDNDSKTNIQITPYIENPVDIKVKRNELELRFENKFKDNTTYTIYLNNCIKDLTENNINTNLKYVFSTGKYIDSAKVKVKVKNLLDEKPLKNGLISLYDINDTVNINTSKPMYFTYTNDNGEAELTNIKNGYYNIYALEDKNKNKKYEENETIAFIKDSIKIDSNEKEVLLHPIIVKKKNNIKISTENSDNIFKIKFNQEIDSIDIVDTNFNKIYINKWYSDKYNINLVMKDTLFIGYILHYNIDNEIDTLDINFKKTSKNSYIKINIISNKLKPEDKINLILSNKPTLIVDSLIYFLSDTVIVQNNGWKLDSTHNILQINPANNLINYKLQIDSNAIQNEQVRSKEFVKVIETLEEIETGSINGKIICNTNCILQLLDDKYKIIEEKINPENYTFNYLTPGTYKMRLVIDNNNNKKWDDGNYKKQLLAEDIIFHKSNIIVKKNWEINDINIIFKK